MFSRFLAPWVVAALAATSLLPAVSAGPFGGYGGYDVYGRQGGGFDLSTLTPKLSKGCTVYVQGTDGFKQYTIRWNALQQPTVNAVIMPNTEQDVATIVKFAYDKNIPILAYNGHHGAITTLGRMDFGIEIYMPRLNSISISSDKQFATIGGGTNSKNLTDTLWAAGKQTVTGTCECVSYMGPALGGGHGWLEGRYGLVADQFVSMNVVLANGDLKTIDANTDLWWAMRGAGHNYGIVTSVKSKIYDIISPKWSIETIIFSGDKVADIYDAANKNILQSGNQADDINNWSYWLNSPDLDSQKPVIIMYIMQQGVDGVDPKYTKVFHDLKPLVATKETGTYKDLARWTNIAMDSAPCQDFGVNTPRFPIYHKFYTPDHQKKLYDTFAAAVGGSSVYNNSIMLIEDYATRGVRNVARDSSAFAFRDDLILTAPLIIYPPTDKAGDDKVQQLGNQLRDIVKEGTGSSETHAYVNYAYGDEGPKGWYGSEQWRQDRLKSLKQKYDPKGKFSFYGPVA